jgi:hypothetical protein
MAVMIRLLMFIWLFAGGASLVAGIYMFITGQQRDGYLFMAFAFVGVLMFALNRKRLKLYKERNQSPQNRK